MGLNIFISFRPITFIFSANHADADSKIVTEDRKNKLKNPGDLPTDFSDQFGDDDFLGYKSP